MRPLKTTIDLEGKTVIGHGDLMNHRGAYCATCEVPLLAEAWLWHAQTNQIVAEPAPANQADDLLLLCHNCHQAFDKTAPVSALKNMLLPHRDNINIIGSKPHMQYVLQEHTYEVLDDAGNTIEAKKEKYAVVIANTPEAQKTIDHFALNTPYHDLKNKSFKVPQVDHLSRTDARVELRTRAWITAQHMLQLLASDKGTPLFEGVCEQIRHISAASGFWSVWVTLCWNEFQDLKLLEKIFWQPENNRYYHDFPGTSRHYFKK